MDIATLKSRIQSNKVPQYLIFAGPEWKVQDIYIKQIAKQTGNPLCRIDSVQSIYSSLKSHSIVKTAYTYVVRDDKDLMQNEKLQSQISSGILGNNILIHVLTTIDKRTKFYKRYTDDIITFDRLSEATLKKYTLKEIKLSERNLMRLIAICENDYGRILLEIDKIKRYAERYEKISNQSLDTDTYFQTLVDDGTIYIPPYDAIFDLVDAILDRKVNVAFDLMRQSYAVGEATLVMLSVLYSNAKAVLQVQTYQGNNLSRATGLNGWQIKNARAHVNKYSECELIRMLKLISKVERGIKTGRIEEPIAMQYLLIHVM